ncbi:MAG: 16S rRNA (guanine(527)-N(7))-methyltransferase RsmG [Candidatus Eremiobacteraeota bacterium]|nr:16S rRNA (guanine(527)-N(7))-methyltransferase RsmG [Candidatus Eremiobacteraeota bacterium]
MSRPSDELAQGLAQLGFADPSGLAERLRRFGEALIRANQQTNLVGARSEGQLVAAHLLDSLAPLAGERLQAPIIDVGSGAGLPGIPVALSFPELSLILLEPRAKRAAFLTEMVKALGLRNVRVDRRSAETAARGDLRDFAETALARALARPARALDLALPLLKPGGRLFLYSGRDARPGAIAADAMKRNCGDLLEARPVCVPYLEAERHVWIVRKRSATPPHLPPSARARRTRG